MVPTPCTTARSSDTERNLRPKIRKAISFEIAFSIPRLPGSRPEAVSGMLLKQAGRLSFGHFFSLWSFWPLRHFKFDFLALFEGLEAFALDGAVVNEDIR